MQWIIFTVRIRNDVWTYDFAIERDGETPKPPKQRQFVKPVLRECGSTCIGVPLSTGETTEAAVVYKPPDEDVQAVWRLPDEIVSLFDVEPELKLQSAEIVDENGDLGIRFTVENIGPRDAGFRGAVAITDFSDVADPVGFWIPKGETVTKTVITKNTREMDPDRAKFTHEISPEHRAFVVDANRPSGGETSTVG